MAEKPQIILHSSKALNYTIFDTKWVPKSARVVILGSYARGTGAIQVLEISKGELNVVTEAEKPKSFKCGTFGASSIYDRHLATGDFDGTLNVWDLENLEEPVFAVKAHSQIINSVDGIGGLNVGIGPPELVTGSRDGIVKVWDTRQEHPVTIIEPVAGEIKRDCWAVTFGNAHSNEERCVTAGYDNGDIKMFDLRTTSVLWEINIDNGVCSLEFDRKDIIKNKLVATSLESKINIFDLRTLHPKKGFARLTEKGHNSTIWCVRHLPQNRDIFMTTGGTGSLCLWKYNYPGDRSTKDSEGILEGQMGSLELLQSTVLSQQPIISLDWSPDKTGLCVCGSFDQTVRTAIITRLTCY